MHETSSNLYTIENKTAIVLRFEKYINKKALFCLYFYVLLDYWWEISQKGSSFFPTSVILTAPEGKFEGTPWDENSNRVFKFFPYHTWILFIPKYNLCKLSRGSKFDKSLSLLSSMWSSCSLRWPMKDVSDRLYVGKTSRELNYRYLKCGGSV